MKVDTSEDDKMKIVFEECDVPKPLAKVEPDHVRDATEKVGDEITAAGRFPDPPVHQDLAAPVRGKFVPHGERDWKADFDKIVAHCVTIGIGANAIKRILEGK